MTKINPSREETKKTTGSPAKDFNPNEEPFKSIKAKANEKRSFLEIVIDRTTALFGSHIFLFANVLAFITWIIINSGVIPGVKPFDKFPFSLLTTVVSLEAIIVSILVLTSQNRASRVADLREEVQLQVNVLTEEEITKMMGMLVLLLQKNNIPIPDDKRLHELLQDTDIGNIEKRMEEQIETHQ